MFRILSSMGKACVAVSFCVMLAGCSTVELASHYTKKLASPLSRSGGTDTKSQGHYKVGTPYKINGRWYHPREDFNLVQTGVASWYGPGFHGKTTANGERYDQYAMTAAHPTLQMPSIIRVTNLENGRTAVLRVNDRGPFARGRVLDVSKAGARQLGFERQGTARVRIEVMREESMRVAAMAKRGQSTANYQYAAAQQPARSNPPTAAQPQPQNRSMSAQGYQVASTGRSVPVVTEDTAYLVNDATMDFEYEPLGNVQGADLPESLQRPVLTARQIEAVDHDKKRGRNLQQPPRWVEEENLRPTGKPQPLYVVEAAAPAPQTAPQSGGIFVQAGAFNNSARAEEVGRQLSHIAPVKISPVDVQGRPFYRVRLGPLDTVEDARQIERLVTNTINTETRVVIEK
ncbi:MAG: septal ring lytic transglycosylase RlpA family protein [Micavibrio sp.]|nr:MAG: septal ring lytic transglycosylase RlpA family protein [Micavibrio sp.]